MLLGRGWSEKRINIYESVYYKLQHLEVDTFILLPFQQMCTLLSVWTLTDAVLLLLDITPLPSTWLCIACQMTRWLATVPNSNLIRKLDHLNTIIKIYSTIPSRETTCVKGGHLCYNSVHCSYIVDIQNLFQQFSCILKEYILIVL